MASRSTRKEKDNWTPTRGQKKGNYAVHRSNSVSTDDKINKLEAELDRLKANQGIGSSSHRNVESPSPVSKRKSGRSELKVCTEEPIIIQTGLRCNE